MLDIFSEWINNGHNNFEDKNTCILQIKLTDGVLFSQGTRYDIDFTKQPLNFNLSFRNSGMQIFGKGMQLY